MERLARVPFSRGHPAVVARHAVLRTVAGIPALLPLPIDHPEQPLGGGRGRLVSHVLSRETTGALEALVLSLSGSPFMVGLSAFAALLSRLSGTTDILIGTPIVNVL